MCRGGSGRELRRKGVGDWDGNIRGEMHARAEARRSEEINRGRKKKFFFTGLFVNYLILVIFWGWGYRGGGPTGRHHLAVVLILLLLFPSDLI